MNMRSVVLLVVAIGGLAPAQAEAGVVHFSDRAAFQAAAPGLTTIDFNDQVVPPSTFRFYPGATVSLSGVTFSTDNNLFAVTSAFDAAYGLGDGAVLSWQGADPDVLTISLPAGTTAVGMDFGSFGANPFTFALSSGEVFVLIGSDTPTTTPVFAGFISDVPIASLTSTFSGASPQIDRFVFGTAVPEPSALLLGVTGLLALLCTVAGRAACRNRLVRAVGGSRGSLQ
jgi:hypothetical protein